MKQSQHLRPLRQRLARLRRLRRRFRWATAASAVAIAVLWALAGVFVLDWQFQRNIDLLQRLLLLGLAAAAVIWAFVRFALPWLGKREDITDMALLVQRQAGIDSDLVAALEFESAEAAGWGWTRLKPADAARWGSKQLQGAVIDQVAARQKNLDVLAAVPHQPLARRLTLLIATAAVWGLLAFLVPEHLSVFFRRLAFGAQHYPSRTQVIAIAVNGKPVDLSAPSGAAVHVPPGRPVRFDVTIAGAPPASGRVEIASQARGAPANVPLEMSPGDGAYQTRSLYRGEYAGLSQSARYQVFVGDAWTDQFSLSVTPLPVIEMEAEVVPPVYARQTSHDVQKLPHGMWQFSVLAGAEVRLKLDSDRPLKAAEVTIAGQTYPLRRAGAPAGGEELWMLPSAGTPLASVAKEISYRIQVHDIEGQTLEPPLEGAIGIDADLPPAITAKCKTPIVLPTGSPNIHYEAADDHALGCIWLTWEATSDDTSPSIAAAATTTAPAKREGRIEVCRFPPEASPRNREADYPLALRSLPLQPGDTLKVTFHASDFRGPVPSATADADPPLVFQVTDLHGFEASMYDADQKSAGVLEDIRKKHSGLGDTH